MGEDENKKQKLDYQKVLNVRDVSEQVFAFEIMASLAQEDD